MSNIYVDSILDFFQQNWDIQGTKLFTGRVSNICEVYCVLDIIDSSIQATTCEDHGTYKVQISIYDGQNRGLDDILSVMESIRETFDNLQDTNSEYSIDMCQCINEKVKRMEKSWQGIIEYKIFISDS
jgi:hypothetical protein